MNKVLIERMHWNGNSQVFTVMALLFFDSILSIFIIFYMGQYWPFFVYIPVCSNNIYLKRITRMILTIFNNFQNSREYLPSFEVARQKSSVVRRHCGRMTILIYAKRFEPFKGQRSRYFESICLMYNVTFIVKGTSK